VERIDLSAWRTVSRKLSRVSFSSLLSSSFSQCLLAADQTCSIAKPQKSNKIKCLAKLTIELAGVGHVHQRDEISVEKLLYFFGFVSCVVVEEDDGLV